MRELTLVRQSSAWRGGLPWFRLTSVVLATGMIALPVRAQQGLTGTVLNSRSLLPISGAQVTVVGSTQRAITNAEGRFRIDNAGSSEATLRATAIGYQPATQTARTGADVRLLLTEMAVKLDEVVVTGTVGAVEKRSVANAISKISATDVVDIAPVTNGSQMITGRAAGALVRQGNGTIGGGGAASRCADRPRSV